MVNNTQEHKSTPPAIVQLAATAEATLRRIFSEHSEVVSAAVTAAVCGALMIVQQRRDIADIADYVETKSSAVDPVTIVDKAAEQAIGGYLQQARLDDAIRGEEGTARPGTSGMEWIIDPIDGTVNFIYGIPQFAVSVAATVAGVPTVGAVINVMSGQLYLAAANQGAWLFSVGTAQASWQQMLAETPASASMPPEYIVVADPARLQVNQPPALAQALVATGFSYQSARRAQQAALLATVLPAVRDIRRMGSAALDLCAVATGWVDAYYEHGIHPWDYAAGWCIAQEAGAIGQRPAMDTPGSCGELVWIAAPSIAGEFEELLQVGPQKIPDE